MPRRNTPEEQPESFSLSSLSDKGDLFESYRNRSADQDAEQAAALTASYAELEPEEREAKTEFDRRLQGMLKDIDAEDNRTGYRRARPGGDIFAKPRRRSSFESEGLSTGAKLAGLAVVGAAALFGPGLIADANYGEERAAQFLEKNGYENVEHLDTSTAFVGWQGCDGSDNVKYSFEATAQNGVDTTVLVCKGMFKGATIRD